MFTCRYSVGTRQISHYVRTVNADQMHRLRMVGLVMGLTERAVRTWPLGEWALLRRVLPDGGSTAPEPRRFMPDKGSSLALDGLLA